MLRRALYAYQVALELRKFHVLTITVVVHHENHLHFGLILRHHALHMPRVQGFTLDNDVTLGFQA